MYVGTEQPRKERKWSVRSKRAGAKGVGQRSNIGSEPHSEGQVGSLNFIL